MKKKSKDKMTAIVMAATMIGNCVTIPVAHNSTFNIMSAYAVETNISEGGWHVGYNYTGNAKFYTDDTEYYDSSELSFVIDNNDYNDAYIEKTFKVEPNSKYKFSAMVKCYGSSVDSKAERPETGASIGYISEDNYPQHSSFVSNDEWTRVECTFTTGSETQKTLFLRNGRNWGCNKGVAYFSDISLNKMEKATKWDILVVPFKNVDAKITLKSNGNKETDYEHTYSEDDINKLEIMLKDLKNNVIPDIAGDCMSINYKIQPCDVTITDLIVDEKKIEKDEKGREYILNLGINPDSEEVRNAIEPYLRDKEYDQIMFFAPVYETPNYKTKTLQTPVGGSWYSDGINYCKFPVSFPDDIKNKEECRGMEYGFLHELIHGIEARSRKLDSQSGKGDRTISLDLDPNKENSNLKDKEGKSLYDTTYRLWYKAYMHREVDDGTKNPDGTKCLKGINPDAYYVYKTNNVEKLSIDMTVNDSKIMPLKVTIYGDVNCDGKVNQSDVDYLNKYFKNKSEYISAKSKINADVYWPGSGLNKTDANYINQTIKGKSVLPVRVLGDINFDDKIDIEDYRGISSFVHGENAMTATAQKAADVNFDTGVDVEDALMVINHINGIKPLPDYPTIMTTTTTIFSTTTTTTTAPTTSKITTPQVTTPQVITPATTNLTTRSSNKAGDANVDGKTDMADVVLIMQYLANPNKFGINGADEHHITEQGLFNTDVDKSSEGVTGNDALKIQQYLLGIIESL